MKWLPKEKRTPFITVVLVTAMILAGIGFGLISSQNATLSKIETARKAASDKLVGIENTIRNAGQNTTELADATKALAQAEQDMASGDYYSWTYDTMRLFKQPYKVEIPEIGHPTVEDVDILPSFPYKQIRFSIQGKGYYHDLGKFLADFENAFPHARVVNLVIEPAGSEGEKLSFRMDIIVLAKS